MLRYAITAGCLLCATTALAQFTRPTSGGSQSYGAFGARNIGGGTTAGTSGFGAGATSSLGGSRQQGGLGAGGLGAGGLGAGGMGSGGLGAAGGNPLATGNTQMRDMRAERQTAGFVGADASDAANVMSMQGIQNQMQMNSLQNAFSQFGRQNQQRNQNRNQNTSQRGQKPLRVSITADIPLSSAASAPTTLGRQFETRLTKLPGLDTDNSVRVTMEGRTAVLSGSVASERDRKLVEGLALLEPGISSVQNELVVLEGASRVEELPAPRR